MSDMTVSERQERPPPVRRSSSRVRLAVVGAVILGAIAFLLVKGLGDATTYFRNADEALADREELGERRFRLQGTVVDEPDRAGDGVAFAVEFGCAEVDVVHTGDPPELFREGIPVVLEGAFLAGSDTFASDTIRVRHTNEYRTEEADRLELAEEEACAR
ncbi:MAG: cytochrome c maturation protein CcmE [Acidimicrobiia bacterium]|nr:cytochrome c maturation protein CcmE [Acidimicrobiia bacterium]